MLAHAFERDECVDLADRCDLDDRFDVPRTVDAAEQEVFRIAEGRPNVLDLIKNGEMNMIINTPSGTIPRNKRWFGASQVGSGP